MIEVGQRWKWDSESYQVIVEILRVDTSHPQGVLCLQVYGNTDVWKVGAKSDASISGYCHNSKWKYLEGQDKP